MPGLLDCPESNGDRGVTLDLPLVTGRPLWAWLAGAVGPGRSGAQDRSERQTWSDTFTDTVGPGWGREAPLVGTAWPGWASRAHQCRDPLGVFS